MKGKTLIGTITFVVFIVFAGMAVTGTYMTYSSVSAVKAEESEKANELKLKIGKESVEIELTTAIPGLVISVLGVTGLLLLLIKVPVREAFLARETATATGNYFLMGRISPKIGFAERKVPLPVWWLIKGRKDYVCAGDTVSREYL